MRLRQPQTMASDLAWVCIRILSKQLEQNTPPALNLLSLWPVCPQVPDVWWWPWPAVTGVAGCLSCPIRNQEDWRGSGTLEQRIVGEFTAQTSRALIPTGEDRRCKSHLATESRAGSPSWRWSQTWKCRFVERRSRAAKDFCWNEHNFTKRYWQRVSFHLCLFRFWKPTLYCAIRQKHVMLENKVCVLVCLHHNIILCLCSFKHISVMQQVSHDPLCFHYAARFMGGDHGNLTPLVCILFSSLYLSQAAATASWASGHTGPQPPSHIEPPP